MEKQLIEDIARAIVSDPDSVEVTMVEGEKTTIFELRVAPNDIGKIVGQGGRIARAIRTVLSAISYKGGRRATLEILD